MTTPLPAFSAERDAAFVSELKQRVNAYFDDAGIDPYANPAMVAKTVVLLTTFGGVYGLLLTGWFRPWAMLGLVVVLAVALAGIGFRIVHDTPHGAYARTPWINRLVGLILGTAFMLAHMFESTAYAEPGPDGRWEDGWHVHQLRTTADFARSNRLLTCYLGGLNYQVEHHLFPGLCSVHCPAISPIVERTAHEHGLPYNAVGTVRAALATHQRLLRRLGRRPRMSSALGAGA